MTLDQLLAQITDHVEAGDGDCEVEVRTPTGEIPAITSLEIVEGPPLRGAPNTKAIFLT